MRESLAESLRIAARSLPEPFLSPAERARLLRLAQRLAPIHCAGFEIRLTGARGRVDLQQRIRPGHDEPQRVAAHLRATGLLAAPGWRRIDAFLRAWSQRTLSSEITECWFEYEPTAAGSSAPSVFLSLKRRRAAPIRAQAIRRALTLLAPPAAARRLAQAILKIADRLPDGAQIFDFGLMTRQPAVLRINVGGAPAAGLGRVLAALDWDSAMQQRVAAFALAIEPFACHLKLAFDWYGKLGSRIGLEIYPGGDPERPHSAATSARWARLLDRLEAQGCCAARRATPLLDWPGQDEPPSCELPWPGSLAVESLVHGPREFSVIGRRLSHVKVDFSNCQSPAPKAYFGFGPVWRRVTNRGFGRAVASRTKQAMAAAAAFLLDQRTAGAAWRDFPDILDGSDEWVSAYVASALAHHGGPRGRHAARDTWAWLATRGAGAGWRYNAQFVVDADSTLWALRLAEPLAQLNAPRARAALALLRAHRGRDGGLATFLPENLGAARAARLPPGVAGWCQPHAEVTAAGGVLPGLTRSSARWLLRAQQTDGRWESYWFDDDAFATALAVEQLAGLPGPTRRSALSRAATWAVGRVEADGAVAAAGPGIGSAFAAASCLRILLTGTRTDATGEAIRRLTHRLLESQRADGGWLGTAPLRVPFRGERRPATTGLRAGSATDAYALFTTATVLEALGRLAASNGHD
jgi:hypothetical protein